MKKFIALIIAAFMMVSSFAVCEPIDPVSPYDRITMDMTDADVVALLGEGQEADAYLLFAESVLCAFYESGRLHAKAIAFGDIRDIAPFANIPMDKLKKLKQGALLEDVIAMIGSEGLEIMALNIADEENAGQRRVLAWQDADGEAVQMLFELDDGGWKLFAAVEIPAATAAGM